MSTKPFRIETLITGFSQLLWLTLLALFMLGKSPDVILNFLSNVESGTAVFLFAVIVGVSFFLGTLAEHFLIVLSYCLKNKEGRKKTIESFKGTPEEIWGSKSFFLSMAFGLPIIVSLLFLSNKFEVCNWYWTILTIGMILELGTVISFLFWRHIINIKLKNNG